MTIRSVNNQNPATPAVTVTDLYWYEPCGRWFFDVCFFGQIVIGGIAGHMTAGGWAIYPPMLDGVQLVALTDPALLEQLIDATRSAVYANGYELMPIKVKEQN